MNRANKIMSLNKKPMYRKIIVPWHDSLFLCLITILFMVGIFFLGLSGVFVAMENPEYQRHAWVPAIFVISGVFVVISIIIRLVARYARPRQRSLHRFKFPDFEDPDKKKDKRFR